MTPIARTCGSGMPASHLLYDNLSKAVRLLKTKGRERQFSCAKAATLLKSRQLSKAPKNGIQVKDWAIGAEVKLYLN